MIPPVSGELTADAIEACNAWLQGQLRLAIDQLVDAAEHSKNAHEVVERDVRLAFRFMGKEPAAEEAATVIPYKHPRSMLDSWFNLPKRRVMRKALAACFVPAPTSVHARPFRAGYDNEEEEEEEEEDDDDDESIAGTSDSKRAKPKGVRKVGVVAFTAFHELFSSAFARPLVIALQKHLATSVAHTCTKVDAEALVAKLAVLKKNYSDFPNDTFFFYRGDSLRRPLSSRSKSRA
jgi:16S rRNA C967 or C1407 C5-methylase (RsmB/RsmF family)